MNTEIEDLYRRINKINVEVKDAFVNVVMRIFEKEITKVIITQINSDQYGFDVIVSNKRIKVVYSMIKTIIVFSGNDSSFISH